VIKDQSGTGAIEDSDFGKVTVNMRGGFNRVNQLAGLGVIE
jgi:hypothetical protein